MRQSSEEASPANTPRKEVSIEMPQIKAAAITGANKTGCLARVMSETVTRERVEEPFIAITRFSR